MSDAVKPAPMFPVDVEGAPKIVLAGKEWPVVPAAIAQAKKIVPAMMALGPRFLSFAGPAQANDAEGLMRAMGMIDEVMFEKIADIVYYAIQRGHPGLSRAEFEQIPATLFELVRALPIIMQQTGFVKLSKPGDVPAGEAQAG